MLALNRGGDEKLSKRCNWCSLARDGWTIWENKGAKSRVIEWEYKYSLAVTYYFHAY